MQGTVEEPFPFVKPCDGPSPGGTPQFRQVLPRNGQVGLRVAHYFSGDGVRQPEASPLVSGEPDRAGPVSFEIGTSDSTVSSDPRIWQVSRFAEVDDVLTRTPQQRSCLTGGEEFLGFAVADHLTDMASHLQHCIRNHKKHNVGLYVVFVGDDEPWAVW